MGELAGAAEPPAWGGSRKRSLRVSAQPKRSAAGA